jgi:hypothetical protein
MEALYIILALVAALIAALVVAARAAPSSRVLDASTATIFVTVPSYRDRKCRKTLHSMFANARYPGRVFAGVYEQNADGAERCTVEEQFAPNVRTVSVHASAATGPCTARYECARLMREEDVYLQVDSHTEFARDWDVLAVQMLLDEPSAREGRSVLSTYPVNCGAGWHERDPPVIDGVRYSGAWFLFNATMRADARRAHAPSLQVGGGFLLCLASVVRRVELDPHLAGLFNHEELLYTARLYTHGIDVLAPTRCIVCHDYAYGEHRSVWSDNPGWNRHTGGARRADALLRGTHPEQTGRYGMGTARSLDDFWRRIGVDYAGKTTTVKTSASPSRRPPRPHPER